MDLFDVKARGLRSPLNSREISHLVRAGYLPRHTLCKPTGEASWRTIDELFPLLTYGMGGYTLPPSDSQLGQRRLTRTLLSILVVAATGAAAFFFRDRFIHGEAGPPQTSSHRASAPVVIARNN